MDERERAEVYLKLYEIQVSRFHERANREFKMIITFSTALAIFTGFLAPQTDVSLPLIAVFVLIGCLYVPTWLYGFWRSNAKDKRMAAIYRSYTEKLIGYRDDILRFEKPGLKDFLTDWATISQIVALVGLLSLSLWLIHIV